MKSVTATAPGKLYIAGEYAVTDPGNTAVIAAVDRHLSVRVRPSTTDRGTIASSHFPHQLTWFYDDDARPTIQPPLAVARLALAAMTVAGAYVQGRDPRAASESSSKLGHVGHLPAYHVEIDSQLDDPATGIKYGLGSSAALIVATIRAVTQFFGIELTNLQVYKLAMIANVLTGSEGSGGDIAASSHGGLVFYSSPERTWISEHLNQTGKSLPEAVASLLETPWPHLEIEPIPALELTENFVVGWTSQPVSTEEAIRFDRSVNPDYYANFIAHSNVLVARITLALREDHYFALHSAISSARILLADLSATFGLNIETPLLTQLCDAVVRLGGSAKPSGAGGGDCGIGFLPPGAECGELVKHWQEVGITALSMQISPQIPDTLG